MTHQQHREHISRRFALDLAIRTQDEAHDLLREAELELFKAIIEQSEAREAASTYPHTTPAAVRAMRARIRKADSRAGHHAELVAWWRARVELHAQRIAEFYTVQEISA